MMGHKLFFVRNMANYPKIIRYPFLSGALVWINCKRKELTLRLTDSFLFQVDPLLKGFLVQESKHRVATVREKYLEIEIFSRSGKSQGILWMAREI